jgi:uncharacterized integral membrane protein
MAQEKTLEVVRPFTREHEAVGFRRARIAWSAILESLVVLLILVVVVLRLG